MKFRNLNKFIIKSVVCFNYFTTKTALAINDLKEGAYCGFEVKCYRDDKLLIEYGDLRGVITIIVYHAKFRIEYKVVKAQLKRITYVVTHPNTAITRTVYKFKEKIPQLKCITWVHGNDMEYRKKWIYDEDLKVTAFIVTTVNRVKWDVKKAKYLISDGRVYQCILTIDDDEYIYSYNQAYVVTSIYHKPPPPPLPYIPNSFDDTRGRAVLRYST